MIEITEKDDCIFVNVRVAPRASKSEIAGEHDGALKVRIASPPVDGAANEELTRLISKTTRVSRSQIEIISGLASKSKTVRICGISAAEFRQLCGLK